MADVERVRHQADLAQQLDRRHLVLADDVEHLVDVVGGMDRGRQVALLRGLRRLAHQRHRAGLDLARHQDAAHAVAVRALVALDEFERERELALARRPRRPRATSLPPSPPTQRPLSKPGPEIGADAELADALEQRLLHPQLAAELDEGGDAVAQQLGDRELRVEAQLLARRIVVGADVARIAADPRALARRR